MFVVLTQDDENIAILIYEQEITWMQLFWIRQCQFLLELLWILFTTSHQLALHEWKFRFIYFCNCKIIFFLSLVEKFRRHFCPKYCFGSRVFFFLPFYFLSCFSFNKLRDINSSNILYNGSLGVEPSPLTLDEEWRLMLVPKLRFFLVGGLKTKGKRNYGWN